MRENSELDLFKRQLASVTGVDFADIMHAAEADRRELLDTILWDEGGGTASIRRKAYELWMHEAPLAAAKGCWTNALGTPDAAACGQRTLQVTMMDGGSSYGGTEGEVYPSVPGHLAPGGRVGVGYSDSGFQASESAVSTSCNPYDALRRQQQRVMMMQQRSNDQQNALLSLQAAHAPPPNEAVQRQMSGITTRLLSVDQRLEAMLSDVQKSSSVASHISRTSSLSSHAASGSSASLTEAGDGTERRTQPPSRGPLTQPPSRGPLTQPAPASFCERASVSSFSTHGDLSSSCRDVWGTERPGQGSQTRGRAPSGSASVFASGPSCVLPRFETVSSARTMPAERMARAVLGEQQASASYVAAIESIQTVLSNAKAMLKTSAGSVHATPMQSPLSHPYIPSDFAVSPPPAARTKPIRSFDDL
ncbi:hypothetical protein DIPPA_01092 [Diplonema papillatum]|nr:hypothetical protein DIPPA_01092 [Diplonema papillatum]